MLAAISICCKSTFLSFCALLIKPQLLCPMYPGQVPTVHRNLFNIMFVLHLSQPESLDLTANITPMLIDRSYPMHIGFIPVVETEDGMKMVRVFYSLTQDYGPLSTIQFICGVHECILMTIMLTH